jgi:tetratricopeptide (TPR) repeat protein
VRRAPAILSGLCLAAAFALACPAVAQEYSDEDFDEGFGEDVPALSQDERWCWDEGEEYSPEQQVTGCNALLDGGAATPEDIPYIIAMRGWSYQEMEDYERAIADYSEKIRLQPQAADGYGWRAGAYLGKGDYARAIEDYSRAIQLGPEETDIAVWYHDRGLARHSLEQPKQAIKDYDKAIELNPSEPGSFIDRGYAYYDLKRYRQAVADFSQAIDLAPEDAANWNERCWARAVWGEKLDDALADCEQALELDPLNAYAFDSRAFIRLKQRDWAQAEADYEAAMAIDESYASPHYGRGIALIRLGRQADGEAELARAAELDPEIPGLYEELGMTP